MEYETPVTAGQQPGQGADKEKEPKTSLHEVNVFIFHCQYIAEIYRIENNLKTQIKPSSICYLFIIDFQHTEENLWMHHKHLKKLITHKHMKTPGNCIH